MKNVINIKYTVAGVVVATVVGYILAVFINIPFYITFIIVAFTMYVNGVISSHEDNLPDRPDNPLSQEGGVIESKKNYKWFTPRHIFRVFIFAFVVTLLVFLFGNKIV